jgi:hypothetical protein
MAPWHHRRYGHSQRMTPISSCWCGHFGRAGHVNLPILATCVKSTTGSVTPRPRPSSAFCATPKVMLRACPVRISSTTIYLADGVFDSFVEHYGEIISRAWFLGHRPQHVVEEQWYTCVCALCHNVKRGISRLLELMMRAHGSVNMILLYTWYYSLLSLSFHCSHYVVVSRTACFSRAVSPSSLSWQPGHRAGRVRSGPLDKEDQAKV